MPAARHLLRVVAAAYRLARTVSARPAYRLAAFAALALVATWPLLSTAASMNEFRDAHVLAHYETVARDAVLHWHQLPLWDPYYCGGMYLLGTPQGRFVSPTFLLTLVFGEPRAEALTAFAMIVVGLEGMFRYARARRATCFAAMIVAPIFALSGLFALAPALGWISFYGFELLPWIALGFRRALARDVRGAIACALMLAVCVGFGGTYAAPLAVVWCVFELADAAVRRGRKEPRAFALGVAVAACAGLLSAGLAAVRLWPVADTLLSAPRIIGGTPGNSATDIAQRLFLPAVPDTEHGAFYVGWLIAPAVLLGLARRRSVGPALAAVVCAWLAAGYQANPSLFGALRELPVYAALRYPERFLVPGAMAIALVASQGISLAEVWLRARRRKAPRRQPLRVTVLALTVVTALANVGPQLSMHWYHARGRSLSAAPEAKPGPFHQSRGNRWALGYYEPMQRGSLSCWEAYPVPESPLLRGDAKAEERVLEPGAGSVTPVSWSPNAIDLRVDLARDATVVVNQNWNAGWRASAGEVKSQGGLLAVALGEGTHDLHLRFAPRSATGGGLATAVAIAAAVFLGLRARRRPLVSGARDLGVLALLSVSPAVPAALTAALVHEVRPAAPQLVTPDGRPLVVDDIDEGLVRLDTKLQGDIVLEAATLSNLDPVADTDVTLELDWRRGRAVPAGLGVFVHMEPSSGDGINGDHALLSGVLDLEDAPADKTLRDVIPVHLPESARGKTWKVWVGLWALRRGGERVPVVDSGHAIVDGNRVKVAQFNVR